MQRHQEVERKFDLDPDQAVPDLARGPVAAVGEPSVTELVATYYDTDALALSAARITLRRRTGGEDAGWHLKLPRSADARLEMRLPLGRSGRTVPKELLDQVRVVARDHRLRPVAVLRTTRVERHLLGPDGTHLAVLADDTVTAERLLQVGEGTAPGTLRWRELEVELLGGDDGVLDAVAGTLAAVGISASASSSKVSRVLGDPSADVRPQPSSSPKPDSVGALLHQQLAEWVTELMTQDREARTGEVDAVHDLRVAARRLRSLLAAYRPVLDPTVTEPVRDELRWLGREVGAARDAQVQQQRLNARLRLMPRDLVLGPVRRRAELELQVHVRSGLTRLRTALGSSRYYRLLDALDELAASPPLTGQAELPADRLVPRLVGRQVRRVRRAAAAADASPDEPSLETALHEVRKAAKRARYTAESAMPVSGRAAKWLAGRMEDLQDLLGEHQDAVSARTLHRELGAVSHTAGENGFTFGVLRTEEDAAARAARARFPDVLWRATRTKVTRWTR